MANEIWCEVKNIFCYWKKEMGIVRRFKKYVKSKFNRLADWVTKHAPPVPKIVEDRNDAWNFVKKRSAVAK